MTESVQAGERRWVLNPAVVAAVVVGLAAAVALFVWQVGTAASNEVSIAALEDSEYGVVYLEDHNVFVVATENGPVALVGTVPYDVDRQVRYCPGRDYFISPSLGSQFDRLGRYADGPGLRDMDRVTVDVRDGTIFVLADEVTMSAGRSTVHDLPKGPFCEQWSDDPGFFLP